LLLLLLLLLLKDVARKVGVILKLTNIVFAAYNNHATKKK